MVVGIANRIIWGNDASNRRTGNIEGQQSQPQMGQADFIGNTLTGDVYPLFFSLNRNASGECQLATGEVDVTEHQHDATKEKIGAVSGESFQPWLQHGQPATG